MITVDDAPLGQATVALFVNPDALEEVELGLYRPTADSGVSEIAVVGVGERGSIATSP